MKKPMNFAGIVLGLALPMAAFGCARSPEASAPSAASGETNTAATAQVSGGAAPEANAAPRAPTPPAAFAPPAPERSLDLKKAESQPDDEPQTLEAALRALNRAKADLDRIALAEPSSVRPEAASADRAAPRPGRTASEAQGAGAAAKSKANAACENACRAFSSLTRAADAVCRLDGSSGTHCVHAKQIVADSQQRVARCACSANGE